MPDTYTSQFSGEEIDAALRAAQIISGADTPAELRKKLEIRGDTIPVSAEDSTLISGALKYRTNPNLLDNWYFVNPVNQRGQVEWTTPSIYTIDRWKTAGDGKMSLADGGIKCDGIYIHQFFEKGFLGKGTYTISVLTKNPSGNFSGTFGFWGAGVDKAFSATLDNGFATATFTVPENHDDYNPFIYLGLYNTFLAAKLELGDTQTLAHKENGVWILNEIPDFGEQLRRCQRYYRRWTGADNKPLGVAVRRESKLLELVLSLNTAMRVAPSLTFNGSFVCVPTFIWCSVTSIDIATPDTVAIFLKPNDDVTFDLDAYQINIANANEYIALSADL